MDGRKERRRYLGEKHGEEETVQMMQTVPLTS